MLEVWGEVPKYRGRGRPPTKKRPRAGWQHLRMIKQQDSKGRVMGVRAKVVYGDEPEVCKELLEGGTSYVERTPTSPRDT